MSSADAAAARAESSSRSSPSPPQRRSIAILPQHVVDQIAAGEVVQRPASVVKELLENSLDAGATHVVVHVERGGLSKLSIADNGRGIPKADLPLLATRHATSKLTTVDDLSRIASFGFRGEALASTSMVSRLLTVTTRTADSSVAYTQSYQNGRPYNPSQKQEQKDPVPKTCARKVGTTIVVQDLFYNVAHRQKAYSKRESEEYAKILTVVQLYAIHYPTVGFVCQRTANSQGKGGKSNKAGASSSSSSSVLVDCNTSQIKAVKALLQSRESAAKRQSTSSSTEKEEQSASELGGHNEQVIEATKQVISHVWEANLSQHLLHTECSSSPSPSDENSNLSPNSSTPGATTTSASPSVFQYTAQVYHSSPSFHTTGKEQKTSTTGHNNKFVLFLNHRLVDLPPLKRALEDVYADFTSGSSTSSSSVAKKRPVLVVDIQVPGSQVDVNVHPSKQQVALMYQEDLIGAIAGRIRQRLEENGQAFALQSVAPKAASTKVIRNPYSSKKRKASASIIQQEEADGMDDDETDDPPIADNGQTSEEQGGSIAGSAHKKRTRLLPSQLIRTTNAAPAGAIEPFLVRTQTQTENSQNQLYSDESSTETGTSASPQERQEPVRSIHVPSCPISSDTSPDSWSASIDMTQPGAFAKALLQCNCPPDSTRRTVMVKQSAVPRPKRVIPTQCSYASIVSLRKRIHRQQCSETTAQLRKAFFMGVVSQQRSLLQCGEELVLINHTELAKELFYQLALARFGGGATMAHLGGGGGVHIHTAIAQVLQCEDDFIRREEGGETLDSISKDENDKLLNHDRVPLLLDVSETNHKLAQQATACLLESAGMLEEYFSIRIERHENEAGALSEKFDKDTDCSTADAVLTGLPVLLDGHCPPPHGLPIFLLRLATQVDWADERPCFHGVCKELANFYAMLPGEARNGAKASSVVYETKDWNSSVQHNLFPALSYLLLPSKHLSKNGQYTAMTKLSTLYKVFERC